MASILDAEDLAINEIPGLCAVRVKARVGPLGIEPDPSGTWLTPLDNYFRSRRAAEDCAAVWRAGGFEVDVHGPGCRARKIGYAAYCFARDV